jgi:thioredoxin-like negative regulator of GroEL
MAYNYAGMVDDGIEAAQQLLALDPLAPLALLADSIKSWFSGGLVESMPAVRRAMDSDPENLLMRWTLAYALTAIGRFDEAQREVDWMRATMPSVPYGLQAEALLFAARADAARADVTRARSLVEGLDLTPFDSHLTFHFAEVFALLGEHDRAMEVMALGIRKGFFPVAFIRKHCGFIDVLRKDPRFEALAQEAERSSDAVRRTVQASTLA